MTKSRNLIGKRGVRQAWVDEHKGRHFCVCGCGSVIPLTRDHFHTGVPRFIHGHNGRAQIKNVKPQVECACGCRQLANPGNKYVNGHNGRGTPRSEAVKAAVSRSKRGAQNPQWGKQAHNFKGRTIHASGYILVYAPDHPFAVKRNVMEHRLVLERHLRTTDPTNRYLCEVDGELYLRRGVEVHHVDGVKNNNVVENLKPMTKAEHAAHHIEERGGGAVLRKSR